MIPEDREHGYPAQLQEVIGGPVDGGEVKRWVGAENSSCV